MARAATGPRRSVPPMISMKLTAKPFSTSGRHRIALASFPALAARRPGLPRRIGTGERAAGVRLGRRRAALRPRRPLRFRAEGSSLPASENLHNSRRSQGFLPNRRPHHVALLRPEALRRVGLNPDARVGRGWIKAPAPITLPRRMGMGDGVKERSGRCRTEGLAATAGRFIDRSKRGCAGGERARMASPRCEAMR
jgi:hypothetical protein